MPLDILVPYWGDPGMLQETVRSVLSQTSDDWLLTVVDDAYPDPTVREWLAGIDDPRVRYVRNPENVGITGNFRRCVELATQDRVVMLGCDDLLLPRFVDVVMAAHDLHPDVAMIQPGVQVVDEHGVTVRTLADTVKQRLAMPRTTAPLLLRGEPLAASLLRANWLYWPSLAFRREVLVRHDFRDGLPIIQDLALEIDLVAAGEALLLVPEVCFSYRRHTDSASSTRLVDGSRFRGEQEYFALAAEQMERVGWPRAARAARQHLTSRLHAATLLPRAVRVRDRAATEVLVGHVVGRAAGRALPPG